MNSLSARNTFVRAPSSDVVSKHCRNGIAGPDRDVTVRREIFDIGKRLFQAARPAVRSDDNDVDCASCMRRRRRAEPEPSVKSC